MPSTGHDDDMAPLLSRISISTDDSLAGQAGRLIVQGRPDDAHDIIDQAIRKARPNIDPRFLAGLYTMRGVARGLIGRHDNINDFMEAINICPTYCESWNALSMYHLDCGDLQAALDDIEHAMTLSPDSARLYVTRSAIYLQSGNICGARADCDMAIQLDGQYSQAYANRAVCNCHDDPPALSLALKDITCGIDMDPMCPSLYRVRAGVLHLLDRTDQSLADMDQAVTLQPNDMGLRARRADMHERNGDTHAALNDYHAVLEQCPEMLQARIGRALIYTDLEQWNDALADYKAATVIDSSSSRSYSGLAWAQFHLNQLKESTVNAALALELADIDADIDALYLGHFVTGLIAMVTDHPSDGIISFTSALRYDKGALGARANRATCYLNVSRYTDAQRDLNQCIKGDTSCSTYYMLRCKCRLGLHHHKQAMADVVEAIRLDPDNPTPVILKAQVHIAKRELDMALSTCHTAIEMDPRNGTALKLKSDISTMMLNDNNDVDDDNEPAPKRRRHHGVNRSNENDNISNNK